jgi:hypothetical protein
LPNNIGINNIIKGGELTTTICCLFLTDSNIATQIKNKNSLYNRNSTFFVFCGFFAKVLQTLSVATGQASECVITSMS